MLRLPRTTSPFLALFSHVLIASNAFLASACAHETALPPAEPATSPPVLSAAPAPSPAETALVSESDDPTESALPIAMQPELARSSPKSSFPKATVGDRACWESVPFTGNHTKDFDAILARCGAPTGLAEYAKPVSGKLDADHDKRDTYALKLAGGFCYRYFGVADFTLDDLDIVVEKPSGALVADYKMRQPIAIIESDQPWCLDEDVEYNFQIAVAGTGRGAYTFGVWARPKN